MAHIAYLSMAVLEEENGC